MPILREHILSNDGKIIESLTDLDYIVTLNISRRFLIVPYCHPFSNIPTFAHLRDPPEVVTDLWAERCLQSKRFFEPDEHVLSRPIRFFPISGFEKLVINSTGMASTDLLHLSKAVKVLGASYDQVLKTGISVLLCNSSNAGEEKLRHAHEWRIPVVSVDWLWACIRSGQRQPFRPFLLKPEQKSKGVFSSAKFGVVAAQAEGVQAGVRRELAPDGQQIESDSRSRISVHRRSYPSDVDGDGNSNKHQEKLNPGEGFLKSPAREESHGDYPNKNKKKVATTESATIKDGHEIEGTVDCEADQNGIGLPLQEISPNSPPKSETALAAPKSRLFRHFDGHSSGIGLDKESDTLSASEATSKSLTTSIPPPPTSINSAIKELLGKGKAKPSTSTKPNGDTGKKRLLGRAFSNMSNSSRDGTNVRVSRASSIDSVNTDGLGSVILDDKSQSRRNSFVGERKASFTVRASAQEVGLKQTSFDLGDAALYREEYPEEEEEPPQMTQLGYDNPDDAVALRELLAERRRIRTRKGQEEVKPPESKEGKRIKDDVSLVSAGWRSGRRTRQKGKSP